MNVSIIGTPYNWWKHSRFALLKMNEGNPKVVLMTSLLLLWSNYFSIIVGIETKIENILVRYRNTNDQCKQTLSDQIGA